MRGACQVESVNQVLDRRSEYAESAYEQKTECVAGDDDGVDLTTTDG